MSKWLLPLPRFGQLSHLALDQVALERAEMADEKLAVQMIGLVHERARQQRFTGFFKESSFQVLGAYCDLHRPRHRLAKFWNAQAALVAALPAFGTDDLRIHQHQLRIWIFLERGINDCEVF